MKNLSDYGSIAKLWMGTSLFVYIDEPDAIETILNSQLCLDKGESYKFIEAIGGSGLITLSGKHFLVIALIL